MNGTKAVLVALALAGAFVAHTEDTTVPVSEKSREDIRRGRVGAVSDDLPAPAAFDVRDYGARGDGRTKDTAAIQKALDACAVRGGTVLFPVGTYLTGNLRVRGRTELRLAKGALIKGSADRADYPETTVRIEGELRRWPASLITVTEADGFRLTGPGTIDGNGQAFWPDPGRPRPKLLTVVRSRHVVLENVTVKNAAMWTCHFHQCADILVSGCTILSEKVGDAEPINTDAFDLDGVDGVRICDTYVNCNNDAVALKGGKGPDADDFVRHPENGACQNVLVENCSFGPLCFSGITIGSECVAASNVVMRNARFDGSLSALCIKMRLDTPQTYADIVATNLSGRARQGLWVRTYLSRSKPEWKDVVLPSVATNVLYDAGTAFSTPKPEVIDRHPALRLYRR